MVQHLGLVAIIIFWLGSAGLLILHLPDRTKTLSKHAAKNRLFHIGFAVIELIVTLLLAIHIFGWLIQERNLPWLYGVVAAIAVIGMVVAAFVPHRETGWMDVVHAKFAYGMAVGLLAMNSVMVFSSQVHIAARVVAAVGAVYMAIVWSLKFGKVAFKNHTLAMQLLYIFLSQVPLVLAAYLPANS